MSLRRRIGDLSICTKLTGASLLASGAALLFACAAIFAYERSTFRDGMVRTLAPQAEIIGLNSASALLFNDPQSAAQTLAALTAEPHVVAAAIFTRDGQLFATYARGGAPTATAIPVGARGGQAGPTFTAGDLVLSRPIVSAGETIGSVVIRADLLELDERMKRYAAIIVLVSAASFLVSLVISTGVRRAISRPVERLAEAARVVSEEKNYSLRVAAGNRDELGLLIDTFNEMLSQIQRRDADLEKARGDLEQRVHERTRQLEDEVAERRGLEERLRKQNEQLEDQNRRVEEASRLKSEFLANMSHELRTPLNAIIGFSDLLLDEGRGTFEQRHIRFIEDVLASGRHLLSLINDILDLAKIEAGRATLDLEPVGPAAAVDEARSLVEPAAQKKRIVLRTDVRASRPVRADAAKLRQVLLNLLSNAVKFSPAGSAVEVGAEEVGPAVRFWVRDDGPGIEEKVLARLFQPFVQGENALTKKHEGTGLGLAISKRLVEQHGGTIEVATAVGRGSTFAFRIPAAEPELLPAPAAAAPAAVIDRSPGKPLVLIVEDDPASARLLATHMTGAGYDVAFATTAEEALALANRLQPQAVLLDIILNGKQDGFRVLDELKRNETTRGIAVVVTTVVADRQRGMALGAEKYLVKPIDAGVLLRRLGDLVKPPERGGAPVILAIDDDRSVGTYLAAILEPAGYRLLTAERGREGLEIAFRERPDAFIVDLLLPDQTGFDVIDAIAADERTRGRPIIVLTAANLNAAERARLRERALTIAEKGKIAPDALLAAIGRALGRAPSGGGPQEGGPTILVVDDNESNRELARTILERKRYRVLLAEDGEVGVAIARREKPGLILMDLAMPKMDGFAAARELKAAPETAGIPLVALTALAMRGDEERARAAGFDAYVTKPIERAAIEETVAKLLGAARAGDVATDKRPA